MAIPHSVPKTLGSTTTDVKGLMSIRTKTGQVIGMAYRCEFMGKPVLSTARHVYDEILKLGEPPLIEHKGKTHPFEISKWKIALSSKESDLDVILLEQPGSIFSVLQVAKLVHHKYANNMSIVVWGYTNGVLSAATGTIVNRPDHPFKFNHFASTERGYSGSPVLFNGKVVGIHTGASELNACNTGTEVFWETNIETDGTAQKRNRRRVWDDADWKEYQLSMFEIDNQEYELKYDDSRNYDFRPRPVEPQELRGRPWYEEEEPMDYDAPLPWQESGFQKGPEGPLKPVHNLVLKPKEEMKTETPPVQVRRNRGRKRTNSVESAIQTSKGSTNLAGTTGVKDQQPKKVLDSNPLVTAQIEQLVAGQENLMKRMSILLKKDQLLESGISQEELQKLNENLSTSKPVDSSVLLVNLTRRQERHYNRICHDPDFQKVLRTHTVEERRKLKFLVLNYVISPDMMLKENPHLDFLSTL